MKKNYDRYIISISTTFFMFSIAGSRPLIPLFSSDLGANHFEIGMIVALFSVLPLFLSISLGKMVDKMGSKIPLSLGIALGSLSLIVPFFMTHLVGVYASQVMAGLSQVIFIVSMQTYIGNSYESKERDAYVNLFSIYVAVGSFLGPLVGGYLSEKMGYGIALALLGAVLFVSIPLVLLFKSRVVGKGMPKEKDGKMKSFDLLLIPDLRKAFLLSGIVLLSKDTYVAFFPLLAESKGISPTLIGVIISVNAGAGILIRIILPALVARLSKNSIITCSILIAGISYILHPFFENIYIISLLSFILGLSTGIGGPLSISSTIASLPDHRVGEGLGLRLSFNKLTQVVGPAALGAVSGLFGMAGVFYFSGLLIVGGSFSAGAKRKARSEEKNKM